MGKGWISFIIDEFVIGRDYAIQRVWIVEVIDLMLELYCKFVVNLGFIILRMRISQIYHTHKPILTNIVIIGMRRF